jgi:hypothetical protein
MERSIVLGPGSHTVVVQVSVTRGGVFSVDDWHLTVERSQRTGQ